MREWAMRQARRFSICDTVTNTTMNLQQVKNAFNGERFKTADELAIALGVEPGKKWQRALHHALTDLHNRYGVPKIEPRQHRINGKVVRVYDHEDFIDKQEEKDAREYRRMILCQKLTAKARLDELDRIANGLEEDEPSLKERWRRIRAAIEVERRTIANWEERWDREY
jgi:hypothetical protein